MFHHPYTWHATFCRASYYCTPIPPIHSPFHISQVCTALIDICSSPLFAVCCTLSSILSPILAGWSSSTLYYCSLYNLGISTLPIHFTTLQCQWQDPSSLGPCRPLHILLCHDTMYADQQATVAMLTLATHLVLSTANSAATVCPHRSTSIQALSLYTLYCQPLS